MVAPSAPPEPAQCHKRHACHAKRRWMSPSATRATRNEGPCRQATRLPRKVPRRHRRSSAPKRAQARHQSQRSAISVPRKTKVDVTKCHACHAKRRWISPSATPATRNEGMRRQVPRLPRKTKVDATKCHVCHTKRRYVSPSATPDTQNEGGCHQVPRLPRQAQVCVAKGHACHAKLDSDAISATPATQNEGGCDQVPRLPRKTKVIRCRQVLRLSRNGEQACPSAPPDASPVP